MKPTLCFTQNNGPTISYPPSRHVYADINDGNFNGINGNVNGNYYGGNVNKGVDSSKSNNGYGNNNAINNSSSTPHLNQPQFQNSYNTQHALSLSNNTNNYDDCYNGKKISATIKSQ